MLAFLITTIVLMLYGTTEPGLMTWFMSLFLFATFSFIGYMLDHPRFYLIAALFAISEPLYTYCQDSPDIVYAGLVAYGLTGALIMAIGLATLHSFIRNYPLGILRGQR